VWMLRLGAPRVHASGDRGSAHQGMRHLAFTVIHRLVHPGDNGTLTNREKVCEKCRGVKPDAAGGTPTNAAA